VDARLVSAVALFVAAAVLAMASTPARAVSPAAEALFQEGRRLLSSGQTDTACARFAESYAAEASSGTLLNLALCHEKQGKTATAWAEYRGAARLARQQGREDRAVVADGKVAALEARLPRLTMIAARSVPGLRIATEEGTLGPGGLGVAVPVDPGLHRVTVSAPRYRAWATTVEMKEGEQRTLEIPELETMPASAVKDRPLPTPADLLSVPGAGAVPERRLSVPVVALGALGVAGLVGGTMFALAYRSNLGEARSLCPLDVCRDQAEEDRHGRLVADARRDLVMGLVAMGLGGAALLTSSYLWWRGHAPRSTSIPEGGRLSFGFMAATCGVGGAVNASW
jgi:hypothetical protein